MKIALYEELNEAFEEYNAAQKGDTKMDWYDLLDSIEDRESEEEIAGIIATLKAGAIQ